MQVTAHIDPGVHGCGVSIFVADQLAFAQYASGLGGQIHPLLEPIPHLEELLSHSAPIACVVVEMPQVYDAAKQRGDQRDIVKLAMVAGEILCAARPFTKAALPVEPASWKGQVPKDVLIERIKSKLSAEEIAAVELPDAASLQHNVWDAVGLGLWHHRRLHG